jgi:predicted metal-dependent hydrolase
MTSPTPVRSRHALMWGSQRIAYELTVEDRSDLAITVQPDLRVIVRAPTRKSVEIIEQRIHARGSWIARQLRAFEQYHPLAVQRRFVSGETHWYLGRQYRLRVIDGPQSVRWPAGRLVVAVPRPELVCSVEKALQAWYDMRARVVFAERLAEVQRSTRRLRELAPRLRVQRMEKRWGSCTPRGTITLNTELVRAPKACIDYVIVHELCHFIVPTHSPRFFRVLDTCMPDWESRRQRLNRVRG